MKRSIQLATVGATAALAATVGAAFAPGDAAAGVVGGYQQPASGAVSITSGTNEINVMVINRKDADQCTVTATRKDAKTGTKTLTRTVKLNTLNQHTGIANFAGMFNKTDYTVSGTCVGTKATEPSDEPGDAKSGEAKSDAAETGEQITTNLLGGTNKVVVKVDNSVNSNYAQCLQIVKGVSWDLGLRGAPLETVMKIATTFCPR
ncbi:hypothetical protein [Gordonia sihwensis]|uniref:hypothetical protein n=1 Tax=Gordonia TaxID=2053 RepID=UPI002415FDED|nr:hypothetical protein [Gordonia sihwensis]WFN92387.1 hypothetical protein P5P27_16685 [Gordonia sihwensis]